MNQEMLEIVLTELLEEQKKETITNVEMVSIIKKVLEKLEVLEQIVQPKDGPGFSERLRAIQLASQTKLETVTPPPPQPMSVKTIIKHHFYFKTSAAIAVSFFLIIIGMTWVYLDKGKETDAYRANDIKYRYLQLNASPNLKKILRLTDSLYLYAYDSIKRKVLWMERQKTEEIAGKQPPQAKDEKGHSK